METLTLVDANVLLRYLLHDDEDMYQESVRHIERGAFAPPEVLAEVVYVLRGVYKMERTAISHCLTDLLLDIEVPHREAVRVAFALFSEINLDFVDCLLIAYHRVEGVPVASFDKKLCRNL